MAAHGEYFGYARHGLKLVLDYPVVDLPQVGVERFAAGVHGFRIGRQVVEEDLAQAGRDRPQRRRFVRFRQLRHHGIEHLARGGDADEACTRRRVKRRAA